MSRMYKACYVAIISITLLPWSSHILIPCSTKFLPTVTPKQKKKIERRVIMSYLRNSSTITKHRLYGRDELLGYAFSIRVNGKFRANSKSLWRLMELQRHACRRYWEEAAVGEDKASHSKDCECTPQHLQDSSLPSIYELVQTLHCP